MARGEITGKKLTQTADRAKRKKRGPPSADPKAVEPSAHAEPMATANHATRGHNRGPPLDDDAPKYKRKPVSAEANTLALSIREFCRLHCISEDQFYKMRREGWGPTVMHVGSRTLISHEAAAEWRRSREEAAAKEAASTAA